MKDRIAIVALVALGLAGCGRKDAVEAHNESLQAVASKVAASSIRPLPGRWEGTVRIDRMDIPNMPPDAKRMVEQQLARANSFASCLTPEQAAKPDASFFQKDASGCTYDHFSMADGRIDAKLTCAQGAVKQSMVLKGSYSPDSYAIHMTANGQGAPGIPTTMEMTIDSKRTGACNGREMK